MRNILFTSLIGLAFAGSAQAGPFAPAAGQPGSTAISKDSPAFVQWATGHLDYLPGPNVDTTWQTPEKGLGAAQGGATDIVTASAISGSFSTVTVPSAASPWRACHWTRPCQR